ncbi:MAG: hypothetical protein ACKVZH_14440 [Blastocatellia bacterium]
MISSVSFSKLYSVRVRWFWAATFVAFLCAGGEERLAAKPVATEQAQCNIGQMNPANSATTDLDHDAADWGMFCDRGRPETNHRNVVSPSLDGKALKFSLLRGTDNTGNSDAHFYRNLLPDANANVFTLSLSFQFHLPNAPAQNNVVQAIEFTMNKWYQGKRYEFAMQWRNIGANAMQWHYWDGSRSGESRWIPLNIVDPLAADQWHSLSLEGDTISGLIHYRRFQIDGRSYEMNLCVAPLTDNDVDKLAVAVQLDGNSTTDAYDVFVDRVNFTRQQSQTAAPLFQKNGWAITAACDTAPQPREMAIATDGQQRGKPSELKIHYQIGNSSPQVFSIKGNGTLRPVLPSGEFGGTFYATGYWDCQQGFIQTMFITELNVTVETAYPNRLRLTGKATNLNSLEASDFTLVLSPPSNASVRVDVNYSLTATRAFCVDQTRQAQREGFRLARIASSFLNNQTLDSDQASYTNSAGVVVQSNLQNASGFIFSSPQPMGKSKLFLSHRSSQPRNTPTLTIKFSEPLVSATTPQGFITQSNDPNDDNVDLWGNWNQAKPTYLAGDRLGRFAFTLEATQPSSVQASYEELPPIEAGKFVKRIGSQLALGNSEFRFAGTNTYYLQPQIAYGNVANIREALDEAAALGLSVTRTIGFNDGVSPKMNSRCPDLTGEEGGQETAAIQFSPGKFCEANLVALDQAIAEAKARNIRLILYLTNNFTAYGGIRRYVRWHLGREAASDQEVQLFYTEATIKQAFKNYVRMLLERRNTVTGLLYKDEPAILAWELGNELRNKGGNPMVLLNWMGEMSEFIKSLDQNHLVADGGEGFDDNPNLYGLSNSYPVGGSEGCSFNRMIDLPKIDLASYHLYPMKWGLNETSDPLTWIRRHEELARGKGKVAYLGEFGKCRPKVGSPSECELVQVAGLDAERAQLYDQWLKQAATDSRSSGFVHWQLVYEGGHNDGYSVYLPQDSLTGAALAKYVMPPLSGFLAAVSSASYDGTMLAPESIVSIFGVGMAATTRIATVVPLPLTLDGVQAIVTDSNGIERAAPLFFISPTQLNCQIPAATASGMASIRVTLNNQPVGFSVVMVTRVAPGLFTASSSGQGIAAGYVLRIKANGARSEEPIARFDQAQNRWVAEPINFGDVTDQLFLVLFGTGFRLRSSLAAVTLTIGGLPVGVQYAGPQGDFVGLDQVNALLPRSLAGRAEVDVVLTVDGKPANTVKLSFR